MLLRFLISIILPAIALNAAARDQNEAMLAFGLVDVTTLNPDITVSLMYARPDNFTGVRLYDSLTRAFLHPVAARSLADAQSHLTALHPGYRIKVCDAARPMSAQRRMYSVVRGTSKARYVSNPARGGGLHNYGMAADVTIVDDKGRELDMGTPVDHLGPEAHIDSESAMVARGRLTRRQLANRRLLRRVMTEAGFSPLRSEWWHFNRCSRAQARARYKVIDF